MRGSLKMKRAVASVSQWGQFTDPLFNLKLALYLKTHGFPSFTLANMECTMTSITAVRNFIGCSLFRGQSRNRAISHKECAN